MRVPHEVKWRAATLCVVAFWAWWGTYVVREPSTFWVSVCVAYALWEWEGRGLYCKWMRRRWTVGVFCEGSMIACRECAWEWTADQTARRLAREYGHLRIGRSPEAVRVHINCNLLTGDLPIL